MATVRKGADAIVAAVVATLQANLAAEITAINGVWTDGITLPAIASGNIYARFRSLVPEYPAIVVSSLGGRAETNNAANWAEIEHHIDVSVLVNGDDEPTVEAYVDRYLVAIWEVLMKNQALDNVTAYNVVGVAPTSYGKTGVYKAKRGGVMQAGGWEVAVGTIESV